MALVSAGLACAAHGQDAGVTLAVKPVLCITDRRDDGCAVSVLVTWRSDDPGSYCLHSDLAEEVVRCWQQASSGMFAEERVVRETSSYWLTDGATGARVAEATLEVMTTESDDRRRNRRRRHVWDIL